MDFAGAGPSTRYWALLLPCMLGCTWACASNLGYYKYRKAEWAPPQEAAAVKFPDSMEQGVRLTGPMMAALKVAMDDYRPPGINTKALTPPDKCLANWKYIHTAVLQVDDNLFFIEFSPDLRNCGPGYIMLDAGATYAIDGKGRILARD